MRIVCFALLFLVALQFSCKKELLGESAWVNAVVEDTRDINCGLPRLNFSEDSLKVIAITGEKSRMDFIGKGLPEALNVQGKKLKVLIRKLTPEESFACLTWGPNYPAIKIEQAKER